MLIADYLNVLVLFAIIGIGYFLGYKKIFSQVTNKMFTTLLLNVSLPLMLIISIREQFSKTEFLSMISDIGLPLLSIVVLSIFSFLAAYIFRVDKKRIGVFTNVCAMSSTIFFGIPITLAVFGTHGLPYGLIYYIAQTVLYWTVGVAILRSDVSAENGTKEKFNLKVIITNILSMPFIGFMIGTCLLLLNIKIPGFLDQFGNYLGGMTAPIAMLLVGGLLYFVDFKKLKLSLDIVIVLVFRFIIAPATALMLGYCLNTGLMMLKVTVIMCALPIPNSTVILVSKFKTDTDFSAAVLTYSTLIFLVYMPVLLWIIHNIH